jgi:hypothetical protein
MIMHTRFDLKRRHWLAAVRLQPLAGTWATSTRPLAEVWKDAGCGCCKDWIAHMEKAGFDVRVHETGNTDIREQFGNASVYQTYH